MVRAGFGEIFLTVYEDMEHSCLSVYPDMVNYPQPALDRVMEVLMPILKRSFPRLHPRTLVPYPCQSGELVFVDPKSVKEADTKKETLWLDEERLSGDSLYTAFEPWLEQRGVSDSYHAMLSYRWNEHDSRLARQCYDQV